MTKARNEKNEIRNRTQSKQHEETRKQSKNKTRAQDKRRNTKEG